MEGSAFVNRIMNELSESGIVMCAAAGNDGNWADEDQAFGLMYTDEAGTHRVSSPSTYENALSVASVDNVGFVSEYESLFYLRRRRYVRACHWADAERGCAGVEEPGRRGGRHHL